MRNGREWVEPLTPFFGGFEKGTDAFSAYDSLQRLVAAQPTGPQWGDAYAYDGFGNLLSKTVTKGSVPMMSAVYDPATNRPVGGNYDANGNAPIGTWDVENHLVAQNLDGQAVTYGYDASGKRVMKYQVVNGQPNWTYWIYDIGGREILQVACTNQSCATAGAKVYFGGRMIAATDPSGRLLASTDRLGSVRAVNTNGAWTEPSFFPYGEEKPTVAADGVVKFATYTRDSTLSNQDYADQRYYSNLLGRFFSPDPSMLNANLSDPSSWNMYGYAKGDPANNTDPTGLLIDPGGPPGAPPPGSGYCLLYPDDPRCWATDPVDGPGRPPCTEFVGRGRVHAQRQAIRDRRAAMTTRRAPEQSALVRPAISTCTKLGRTGVRSPQTSRPYAALAKDPKCEKWLESTAGQAGLQNLMNTSISQEYVLAASIVPPPGFAGTSSPPMVTCRCPLRILSLLRSTGVSTARN